MAIRHLLIAMKLVFLIGIIATMATAVFTAGFGFGLASAQMADNATMGNMTGGNVTTGNMTDGTMNQTGSISSANRQGF